MATAELTVLSTGKTYTVDLDRISYEEMEHVEDALDITVAELQTKLQRGSIKAAKIILWIAMRRDDPKIGFDDVPFEIYDIEAEMTGAEPEEVKPNRAARRAAARPKAEKSSPSEDSTT